MAHNKPISICESILRTSTENTLVEFEEVKFYDTLSKFPHVSNKTEITPKEAEKEVDIISKFVDSRKLAIHKLPDNRFTRILAQTKGALPDKVVEYPAADKDYYVVVVMGTAFYQVKDKEEGIEFMKLLLRRKVLRSAASSTDQINRFFPRK